MRRRTFVAASAAALALPSLGRAQSTQLLKFIPQADLSSLDPVWTTATVARNHAFLVYDTLYGQTGPQDGYRATPQMVTGHTVSDDGKTWTLMLRDGLLFHDGGPVRARDCVASIRRWAARDGFGQTLMARTDELSATDDRTILFRLKRPFPLLPNALGKVSANVCAIMPERIAATDPFKQITDAFGSGPYRFRPEERVAGSRYAYERFQGYRPCETGGTPEWTSGPKVAHFERIEWHIIPDPATAAAALQSGEVNGWERAIADLVPSLVRNSRLKRELVYEAGTCESLRLNHVVPPFDKAAVRRALLSVTSQQDVVTAITGSDPSLRNLPCGFFPPNSPMASDAGMDALTSEPDFDRAKRDLAAGGYNGERVVLLATADIAELKAASDVVADAMRRAGVNVDYQAVDFGTVVQRRTSKKPPAEGGWSAFCSGFGSYDFSNPAIHLLLRGNGDRAWFGWPTAPEIEALRDAWLDAPDLATQKRLAAEIQVKAFQEVPYIPLGLFYVYSVYRADLSGILHGLPLFWNIRRT